jgi:hypothetical protein
VLALTRPESRLRDWTADSVYNITNGARGGRITWRVKSEGWLWDGMIKQEIDWRFILCRNDTSKPCAKSDIIRAVRGVDNSTSKSTILEAYAPTSSAGIASNEEVLDSAEKAGVGVGVSVGVIVVLVASYLVLLHVRRRKRTMIMSSEPAQGPSPMGQNWGEREEAELNAQYGTAELAPESEPVEMSALR